MLTLTAILFLKQSSLKVAPGLNTVSPSHDVVFQQPKKSLGPLQMSSLQMSVSGTNHNYITNKMRQEDCTLNRFLWRLNAMSFYFMFMFFELKSDAPSVLA